LQNRDQETPIGHLECFCYNDDVCQWHNYLSFAAMVSGFQSFRWYRIPYGDATIATIAKIRLAIAVINAVE
jgi:hypothetical protein